jgi:hypothetical protein
MTSFDCSSSSSIFPYAQWQQPRVQRRTTAGGYPYASKRKVWNDTKAMNTTKVVVDVGTKGFVTSLYLSSAKDRGNVVKEDAVTDARSRLWPLH